MSRSSLKIFDKENKENLREFHKLFRNGKTKPQFYARRLSLWWMYRRCIICMAQGGDLQWTARLLQESSGAFINGQTTLYCGKSSGQPRHECDSHQIQPVSMATGVLQLVWWSSSSSTPSSTGWLKWNVTLVFASRTVPGTLPIICVPLVSGVATMLFSILTTNTRTALLSLSSPCVGLASSEALVGQRRFYCLSAHLLAFPPVWCVHGSSLVRKVQLDFDGSLFGWAVAALQDSGNKCSGTRVNWWGCVRALSHPVGPLRKVTVSEPSTGILNMLCVRRESGGHCSCLGYHDRINQAFRFRLYVCEWVLYRGRIKSIYTQAKSWPA